MFIEPQRIGKGIGTKMFEHLREGVLPKVLINWVFLLTQIPEDSMRKWDMNTSLNIHQLLRIEQRLIFN